MINRLRVFFNKNINKKHYSAATKNPMPFGDDLVYLTKKNDYVFSNINYDANDKVLSEMTVMNKKSGQIILEKYDRTSGDIISLEIDKKGNIIDNLKNIKETGLSKLDTNEKISLLNQALAFLPETEKNIRRFNMFDEGYIGNHFGHFEEPAINSQIIISKAITKFSSK